MKESHRNLTRRLVLKTALQFGASASLFSPLPVFASALFNPKEEASLSKAAKYQMVFASPYSSDEWQVTPHMHAELKKNIQEMSQGKIYVDIRDKGSLGIGPALMEKVNRGHISAALVSMSNLSPAAPELDILNIPFWSASNQQYVNLITSTAWKKRVVEKIESQRKLRLLFHYIPGPRTATTTKKFAKTIHTPKDTKDIRFRIPSSDVLKVFYDLMGANTQKVAWGKVSSFAENNLIDALDPSTIGLFNGPNNLKQHIGVISEINSVHDGWAAVVSQRWYQSLSPELRLALQEASEKTFQQHLVSVAQVTNYCKAGFRELGVSIYTPTVEEKNIWAEQCGHTHPAWAPVKRRIIGSQKIFDELLEATKENNGFTYI